MTNIIQMTNIITSNFKAHPFHLVSPSPWPIFTCASLLAFTTSGVLTMHGFASSLYFFHVALILLISSMSFWFRDVIGEATYLGNHTLAVQRGLNMVIDLFIVSKELFLSSPPKPHAFVGPPLQSSLDISNILKKNYSQ